MWMRFERGLPRAGVFAVLLGGDAMLSAALLHGCGVTGLDADDCLKRARDGLFSDRPMPPIRDAVLDVDVSTLDSALLSDLGNPAALGIWFPALNL